MEEWQSIYCTGHPPLLFCLFLAALEVVWRLESLHYNVNILTSIIVVLFLEFSFGVIHTEY